jgi:ribosome-associated heat shock protein Hsp15
VTEAPSGKIRLDKWLWYARFVKTRSQASRLCAEGGVRVNGIIADKPAAAIQPGHVLTFALGRHIRVIEIVATGVRRGPAAEAQALYRDLAPPSLDTAMPHDIPF